MEDGILSRVLGTIKTDISVRLYVAPETIALAATGGVVVVLAWGLIKLLTK